ncbi:MAG: lipocalin family protein [Flavobacterium sp.]|nr:lipocalin family protein [Flavobacterium sp.]
MKNLFLTGIFAILLIGCKSNSATATKIDRSSQNDLKGDWILNTVTYPGSDYIQVNSFQLADSKCFQGSTWSFVPNNNKGHMSINNADCTSFSSPITWFINDNGKFVLKILNADEKARKVRDGYVLDIANQSPTSFQLVDQVDVGGNTTNVIYQFQKVN